MKRRNLKIAYWTVTVLFALFMAFSGISGMIGSEVGNAVMEQLGYPLYLNIILGVAKLLGAIVLLQNRFYVLKEWAYAGFAFDIIGASASFILSGMGFAPAIFALVFLVVMFISYWLWKKVYPRN